jgi:predicted Rossmann fold flavoprotein
LRFDVTIVGAGAAGFFAALAAAKRSRRVLLLEKNNKTGVKILMSGGTRCNLTQATDEKGIVEAFGANGRFLHSALSRLSPQDVVAWFESHGVQTKKEPSGKIFPVSDRSLDVRNALERKVLSFENVVLKCGSPVHRVEKKNGHFQVQLGGETIASKKLVVTTGGKSYPECGTTGDGYQWALEFGHTLVEPVPALTPIVISQQWVKELKGVTIEDVRLGVFEPHCVDRISEKNFEKLSLGSSRNSVLFTHFGLSGPAALDVSKRISTRKSESLVLVVDLLPQITVEELLNRLNAKDNGKKFPRSVLMPELPARLVKSVIDRLQIDESTKLAEIKKETKLSLVDSLKRCEIQVEGTRGFKKAEVTAGGVKLKEVNSQSMESRLCEGLFFAGEILDLDGPIGGYNFQSAFCTGNLAGLNV